VKRLTALASAAVVAATVVAGLSPAAGGASPTCEGLPATVVGPNDGLDTVGTEGDDVMVAPLGSHGYVFGYGGDDTICLVDVAQETTTGPFARVLAGPGDDAVYNLRTLAYAPQVELGVGADAYVGSDGSDLVHAGTWLDDSGFDTDADVIDTRGGFDQIYSGSQASGVPNHDGISTGAGNDRVWYALAAGGAIDDGPDADFLDLTFAPAGTVTIDNSAHRATVGGQPVLTWTSAIGFTTSATPTSAVAFVGTEANEELRVVGSVADVVGTAPISTGGGDDHVVLQYYLPGTVDLGSGQDELTVQACLEVRVVIDEAASCALAGQDVDMPLAGVEDIGVRAANLATVRGTGGPDHLAAFADEVVVRGLGGADVLEPSGHLVRAFGGPGADRINAHALFGSSIVRGGRGADVLRGDRGRDHLYGGSGADLADGKDGKDLCVAERTRNCERTSRLESMGATW